MKKSKKTCGNCGLGSRWNDTYYENISCPHAKKHPQVYMINTLCRDFLACKKWQKRKIKKAISDTTRYCYLSIRFWIYKKTHSKEY
jgi:hypothetical protein